MRFTEIVGPSRAEEVAQKLEKLNEGRKTIPVSNHETAAIDDPHVVGQQVHAHMANGRAVNQDGSLSHGGEPFRLTKDQAAALKRFDFNIAKSRLVECVDGTVMMELDRELVELLLALKHLVD
ncbi:MAG: hypothetical protein KGP14_07870 [Betaproteobacteria bacterium]|nr:hypothetical protein [Betaproteobacteria bacterium]